jgi:hypothetical protein
LYSGAVYTEFDLFNQGIPVVQDRDGLDLKIEDLWASLCAVVLKIESKHLRLLIIPLMNMIVQKMLIIPIEGRGHMIMSNVLIPVAG